MDIAPLRASMQMSRFRVWVWCALSSLEASTKGGVTDQAFCDAGMVVKTCYSGEAHVLFSPLLTQSIQKANHSPF